MRIHVGGVTLANAVGGFCVDGEAGGVCAAAGVEREARAMSTMTTVAQILMRHVKSNVDATRVLQEIPANARPES
jgi:hypothetical protein